MEVKPQRVLLLRHDNRYMVMVQLGPNITREYGYLGTDKPQISDNTYKVINEGKANELSPTQAAEAEFDRLLKRFLDEGYKEVDSFDNAQVESDTMDFDNPPKSFCVSKPVSKITKKKLTKLEKHMMYQVKENGLCHWIFKGSTGGATIYTRRMDDHTAKYPEIAEQVENDASIPNNSVLAVELVVRMEGASNLMRFKRMCKISKTDTNKGVCKADQMATFKLTAETPVYGVIFHLPYWDGKENGAGVAYRDVWHVISSRFGAVKEYPLLVRANEIMVNSAADALKWVDDNKDEFEGAVAWDLNDSIEVSFTGKPKRRNAYKLKPVRETDVVALGYEEGKGRREGKVGSLLLGQYKDGELVQYGKIGSGLTDETSEIDFWNFPEAITIEYKERFPDTGAFQHPVFIQKHPDKTPEECVYDG